MFDAYAAVLPHVQSGNLRPLALAGPERSRLLPDLPTVAEGGFPGYGATSWGCLLGPAAMPPAAVAALNGAARAILATDDMRGRLAVMGAEPAAGTPEDLAAFMRREQERYVTLVMSLGIKGTD
jgi:tripartite-type tricarboxylate transporter receptor subunit TctC